MILFSKSPPTFLDSSNSAILYPLGHLVFLPSSFLCYQV
nr:MAG TPA: hypothetical protein [Crassvirales sp.]